MRITQKILNIFLCVILVLYAAPTQPVHAAERTYYVDAVNGDDTNTGLSIDKAWKSAQRVANAELLSGDTVLFHSSQTFYNVSITPNCANLTFGAYGDGERPVLIGGILGDKWTKLNDNLYAMNVSAPKEPYLLKVGNNIYRRQDTDNYTETAYKRFSYDKKNGVLYLNDSQADLIGQTVIQQSEHIFHINQLSNINIKGLKMIMCGGGAVNINGSKSQKP